MKLALSADHRGLSASKLLADRLRAQGHEVQLMNGLTLGGAASGSTATDMCDYPEPAYVVGRAVAKKDVQLGVLICGSGIGMSIAANKVRGVRAALVHDELTAQMSRSHNDANVLCLSADLLGQKLIEKIVDVWLTTQFQGGRHDRRVRKIAAIEEGKDPSTVSS
jgi:ribose 5-phosphate isomerase B